MTSCALHLAASVLAATSGLTVVTAVPIAAVTSLAGAGESPAGAAGIAGTIDTSRAWTISSTGEVRAIVDPLVAGIAWPAG
jgi:hypothetical protein